MRAGIAPIRTATGGAAVRETILYPLPHASSYGRGVALDLQIQSPHYDNEELGAVAVFDEAHDELTIFAVNRGQDGDLQLEGVLRDLESYGVVEHLVLEHADPKAANTLARPDVVTPHTRADAALSQGRLAVTLPQLSWNVIRLS